MEPSRNITENTVHIEGEAYVNINLGLGIRYFGNKVDTYTVPKTPLAKQTRLKEGVVDILLGAGYNMYAVALRMKGYGLCIPVSDDEESDSHNGNDPTVFACPLRDYRLGMPLRIKATPSSIRDLDLPCLAATTVAKQLGVIAVNPPTDNARKVMYCRRKLSSPYEALAEDRDVTVFTYVKLSMVNCALFLFLGITKTHRLFAELTKKKFPSEENNLSFGLLSLNNDVIQF
ncbi:MAG: hypothetical protein SGARI_007682 [Bacillariaceae sp.]